MSDNIFTFWFVKFHPIGCIFCLRVCIVYIFVLKGLMAKTVAIECCECCLAIHSVSLICVTEDFFKDELPKSDLFVLSHVVHNWDDEHLDILLKRVSESLNPGECHSLMNN